MVPKQRPGTPAKESLSRWCVDWAHEDFKIYSVPGEKNLFNDFHSHSAALDHPPFDTLQQQAAHVERKLNAMKRTVNGNPPSEPLHEVDVAEEEVDHIEPLVINRQILVIIPQDPPVEQKLQKHEANMAGKSLLLDIHSNTMRLSSSSNYQRRHFTRWTRRRMQRMETETAIPDVHVYLNKERKIVIPVQDEQLRINIIAAAHQDKHGHCKEKQTIKLINEVFTYH